MADDTANPPINFKAIRRRIQRERANGDMFAVTWPRQLKPVEKDRVWDMTGGRCWYCGIQTTRPGTFQVDHVHPISFGGTNDLESLVPACKTCNEAKAYFSVEEFRELRGGGRFWFEAERNGGAS